METRTLRRRLLCLILVLGASAAWAAGGKSNPISTLNNRSASRAERIKAVKALATSKDPQAIDALIKELSIMDEGYVDALKSSLRALHAVPVLEKRLTDSGVSEEQKVLACIGLRVLHEKSSVPPLIHSLKDESAHVRKEAALALGVIAPADAKAQLLTALTDSDADVRYFAADALSEVRTPDVKKAIEDRLAAEKDPVVRASLLNAQNKLERTPGQ